MTPGQIIGTAVTLGIFVVGLVYNSGQLTQRLKALEDWRKELREDMRELNGKLDRIERLIRGEDE